MGRKRKSDEVVVTPSPRRVTRSIAKHGIGVVSPSIKITLNLPECEHMLIRLQALTMKKCVAKTRRRQSQVMQNWHTHAEVKLDLDQFQILYPLVPKQRNS
jgi:hypothetical protein